MKMMQRKPVRLLAVAVGVAVAATLTAVALGSAPSNIASQLIVENAKNNDEVKLNSDHVKFQTKGPTDIRVQTITFSPGGRTGWHHHPGFVIVAVESGEVTFFDAHCNSTAYGPSSPNGAVFVESGDDPREVRNLTAAPATIYATYVAPDTNPPVFRIEDDAPSSCP